MYLSVTGHWKKLFTLGLYSKTEAQRDLVQFLAIPELHPAGWSYYAPL